MHSIRSVAALAVLLVVGGCATAGAPAPDRDEITEQDVRASRAGNALELIERERPFWLIASRGERSINLETTILVYQDRSMLGGLEELPRIPIEVIRSVHALDAVEAGQLAGLGSQHVERAIVVVTHDDGGG